MQKTLFFLSFLLFFSAFGWAQENDFQAGFIVQNSGDTLRGSFQEQYLGKNEMSLVFKSSQGTSQTYSPEDLVAYGDQYQLMRSFVIPIITKTGDSVLTPVFMRCHVEGIVSLYEFQDHDLIPFFYLLQQNGELAALQISKEEFWQKEMMYEHRYQKTNPEYQKVLMNAFQDCMGAALKVKEYQLKRKDLIKAVRNYHDCLEAPYTWFRPKPAKWGRPQIGIRLGGAIPVGFYKTADQQSLRGEASLLLKQVIPRSREQFALQLELGYVSAWRVASQRKLEYLNPVNFLHLAPSVQRKFNRSTYSLYANAGASIPVYHLQKELIDPYFGTGGFKDWVAGSLRFFLSFGYEKPLGKQLNLQVESRFLIQHYASFQLAVGFLL